MVTVGSFRGGDQTSSKRRFYRLIFNGNLKRLFGMERLPFDIKFLLDKTL